MVEKNQKIHIWMHFSYVTRVCDLSNGAKNTLSRRFFLSKLYLFDSIFSGIVWIHKLHSLMKEFVSLTMIAMQMGKKPLFSYQSNG